MPYKDEALHYAQQIVQDDLRARVLMLIAAENRASMQTLRIQTREDAVTSGDDFRVILRAMTAMGWL